MCRLFEGSPLVNQVWPNGGVCCTWSTFWKISFRILNTALFLNGVVITTAGVMLHVHFVKIENVLVETTSIFPVVIIMTGCVMESVSLIAIKYHDRPLCMLIYFSCLVTFFFLEITTGIVILFLRYGLKCDIEKGLKLHMASYRPAKAEDNIMDKIQSQFSCCGIEEPFDWLNSTAEQVPSSCCKVRHCDTTNVEEIYRKGCFSAVYNSVVANTTLVSIILFATTVVPLVGSALSCGIGLSMIGPAYSPVPTCQEDAHQAAEEN